MTPGGAVATTSAPSVSCASARACWSYVAEKMPSSTPNASRSPTSNSPRLTACARRDARNESAAERDDDAGAEGDGDERRAQPERLRNDQPQCPECDGGPDRSREDPDDEAFERGECQKIPSRRAACAHQREVASIT